MDSCDALIVGGGPAGSSCAWKLRAAGLDVLVLDKKPFPRDKPCAGWITPAVIDELQLDVDHYRAGRVFQPITGFRTGQLGGPEVETDYGRPISYGIRRCEFDHYLLDRSGARLRLGEPVKSLRRADGRWIVNDQVQAPLVVGAGGHFCPVARSLGARVGAREPAVAAQEVEFAMDPRQQTACAVRPAIPELYFCPDLKGYGWCVRKGDFLNVGLGRQDCHPLPEHLEAFCELLRRRGKVPADLPARFKGHAYLLYEQAPRDLLDDQVLLIGDAAGLAYPRSGEGIRPAVESGLLAADVIVAAAGRYRREDLEPYRRRLTARFGNRTPRRGLSDRLPSSWQGPVAAAFLAMPWFARHVVLDRWFLHAHQPPLALGEPATPGMKI